MDDYTQTAFVTHDLERSIQSWYDIAAGPFVILDLDPLFAAPESCPRSYRGAPATDRFRIALGFLGTTQIEIIQPLDDLPSIFGDHLRTRGEVIHHIQAKKSVVTADIFDATAASYERMGMELVATIVQPNGNRVAFYDGLSHFGFFLEIVENGARSFQSVVDMHKLHLERDKHPMIVG